MDQSSQSPLKGRVIQYIDPTEPVAQDDWERIWLAEEIIQEYRQHGTCTSG